MKLFNNWYVCDNDDRYVQKYVNDVEQFNSYGSDVEQVVEQYCNNKRLAVDCGAHYGLVTLRLSRLFDVVHSFEVEPQVAVCLEANALRHGCNNVTIHKCGVLDYTGYGNVQSTLGKTTSLSTFVAKSNIPGAQNNVTTIDSLQLPHLDFLKIDVEGGEQSVIRGAINTIERHSPVIYYEVNYGATRINQPTKITYGELRYGETQTVLDILKPLGYQVVREDEQTKGKSFNVTIKRIFS